MGKTLLPSGSSEAQTAQDSIYCMAVLRMQIPRTYDKKQKLTWLHSSVFISRSQKKTSLLQGKSSFYEMARAKMQIWLESFLLKLNSCCCITFLLKTVHIFTSLHPYKNIWFELCGKSKRLRAHWMCYSCRDRAEGCLKPTVLKINSVLFELK